MMGFEKKNISDYKWYLISYFSLEDSLIGGLRIDRLNKYLLQQGINSKIITRHSSNINDISIQESRFLSKLGSILKILLPDNSITWAYKVYRYLKNDSPNVILSSSPPHGIHMSGLFLKLGKKDIYWIVDFRDPWIENVLYKPNFLKKIMDKKIEKLYLRHANLVLFNTETDLEHYCEKYPFIQKKGVFVRNGLDKIVKNECAAKETELKIVYSGGSYKGKATKNIIEVIQKIKSKCQFKIICDYYGEYDASLENCNEINYKGLISQDAVPGTLANYEFGIAYMPPESLKSGRVLQKFYDYMGSGLIPIIINPSTEILKMMNEVKAGIPLTNEEVNEDFIQKISDQKTQRLKIFQSAEIENFYRTKQFQKILEYLDSIK